MENKKTLVEIVLSVNVAEEIFADDLSEGLKEIFCQILRDADESFNEAFSKGLDEEDCDIENAPLHTAVHAAEVFLDIANKIRPADTKNILRELKRVNMEHPIDAMMHLRMVFIAFNKLEAADMIIDFLNETVEWYDDAPDDFMDDFFSIDLIDEFMEEILIEDMLISDDECVSLVKGGNDE